MIRHIIFFSVGAGQDIAAVREGLKALGTIPHSIHFEVSENMKLDAICDKIDVVVYAEFEDEKALEAFKAHPTYDATTAKVRPMRDLRFSADIAAREGR